MSEQTKLSSVVCFEELWNKGNLSLADQLFTPNYTNHDSSSPDFGHGPESERKRATLYRTAFPDLRLTIEDLIAEGDTRHGPLVPVTAPTKGISTGWPPTGKQFTISGVTIARLLNGKLAESHVNWDALGMMQQLGVVPQLAGQSPSRSRYLQLHKVTLPTLPNQPEGRTTRRAFLQICSCPILPDSCRKAWDFLFSLLSFLISNFLVSFYPARSSPSAPASSSSKKKRLDSHSSRPSMWRRLHVAILRPAVRMPA